MRSRGPIERCKGSVTLLFAKAHTGQTLRLTAKVSINAHKLKDGECVGIHGLSVGTHKPNDLFL